MVERFFPPARFLGGMTPDGRDLDVLRSKRDASRYQILVTIADRQPAVSQQEIAEEVGITAQAVSDYVQGLVEEGFVRTESRGRYEVTKEGVDWLISRTEDLQSYTSYVAEEVVGQVDTDTAIATADVAEGVRVALTMRDGYLHATPVPQGAPDDAAPDRATAVAITDAAVGTDVGVADFDGFLGYDSGTVTVLVVPAVRDGGSRAVDPDRVRALAADHAVVAVAGAEALATARAADLDPDVRFGTPAAVQEAAARGLSVLLLATQRDLSSHTDRLRDHSIGYELLDERDR